MKGIQTSVQLTDQMTAPIMDIINALGMMTAAWNDAENAVSGGLDDGTLEGIRDKLASASTQIIDMTNNQEAYNRTVQQSNNGVDSLVKKLAGAAAAAGLGKLAKGAVEYASDLVEVQNVVDTSFGAKAAQGVNEWSETTLEAFGLNELSAKQYAGTMGAMLKSSGLAGDEVVDMSMKIAELSGDMASFYNLETDEAFAKIRSGISGETEPLKQLGINMNVANLEAYALAHGIETTYSEMTQAEQVTLRYNYLLNAAAGSIGDFEKTSGSFANQLKLVKENFSALTGSIAANALPIMARFLETVNSGLKFMADNASVLAPIIGGLAAVFGLFVGVLAVYNACKAIAAALEPIHAARLAMSSGATFAATVAQYGLNAALAACPITWILAIIILVIAAIIALANHINKISDVTTSAIGVIIGWLYVAWAAIKNTGFIVANIGIGIWNAMKTVAENIKAAFHNSVAGVKGFFYDLLADALNVVGKIAEALNKLPFVEFDYSGISGMAADYASRAASERENKMEFADISYAFDKGFMTFDAFEDGWADEAYKKGAAIGDERAGKFSEFTDLTAGLDGYDASTIEDIANSTADTADAAKDTASTLSLTAEDLKYLRDIAERDVINRFTTAEVKVDIGGVVNNVSSNMDLDGVVAYIADGLNEALAVTAEGVHI